MYCKYVSATHTISSGPRQYCAGVTWFDRYSDRINRIKGRSRNLPFDVTYLYSRVNDRRRASDVFPNISNAFGRSTSCIQRTVITGTNKNPKILNYICSTKPKDRETYYLLLKTKLLLSFFFIISVIFIRDRYANSCSFKPAAPHQCNPVLA